MNQNENFPSSRRRQRPSVEVTGSVGARRYGRRWMERKPKKSVPVTHSCLQAAPPSAPPQPLGARQVTYTVCKTRSSTITPRDGKMEKPYQALTLLLRTTSAYQSKEDFGARFPLATSTKTSPNRAEKPSLHSKLSRNVHTK